MGQVHATCHMALHAPSINMGFGAIATRNSAEIYCPLFSDAGSCRVADGLAL